MADQSKTPADAAPAGASDGIPASPQGEQTSQGRFGAILERLGATGDDWEAVKLDREPETPEDGTDKKPDDGKEPTLPDAQKGGGVDSDADEFPTPTKVEDIPDYLVKLNERNERKHRESLDNQRRSLLGEQQAARALEERNARLEDLDGMSDEALGEKVRTDPKAAAALASRVPDDEPLRLRVQQTLVEKQMPQMFAAAEAIKKAGGPDLAAVMADRDGEEYQGLMKEDGGVFGWLVQRAMSTGEATFKKSAAYRNEIEAARNQGKNDALKEIGRPAQLDRGKPAGDNQPLSDDPKVRAAQRAAAKLNNPNLTVDFNEIDREPARMRRRGA